MKPRRARPHRLPLRACRHDTQVSVRPACATPGRRGPGMKPITGRRPAMDRICQHAMSRPSRPPYTSSIRRPPVPASAAGAAGIRPDPSRDPQRRRDPDQRCRRARTQHTRADLLTRPSRRSDHPAVLDASGRRDPNCHPPRRSSRSVRRPSATAHAGRAGRERPAGARSQTRTSTVSRARTRANCTLVRFGKAGCRSHERPSRRTSRLVQALHEDHRSGGLPTRHRR